MLTSILLLSLALAHDHGPTLDAPATDAAPVAREEGGPDGDTEWNVLEPHFAHHEVAFRLTEGTWMSVSLAGDRIVFDLLGDLWAMPLVGGPAERLTSDAAWDSEPRVSPDGSQVAFVSDRDGNEQVWVMNLDGSGLRKVTDEETARVTDPVWDPSGDWLIVRRRTVDTRSIGVTELWQVHLEGGKPGFALTSLDSDPHAGESTTDGRHVWFSSRFGRFNYDENPVAGLWGIKRLDRETGEVRTVVSGAGSAVRPKISPDGTQLAFVSRDRERTLLEVMDVASGRRRTVLDTLDHDHMEGFALHGVYPDYAWLPDGSGFVLWQKGGLHRVALDGSASEVPFVAEGTWTFHDVQRWQRPHPEEVEAQVIRWPVENASGDLAFSALGQLWVQRSGQAPTVLSEGTGTSPAWSPDGRALAWTSWRDCERKNPDPAADFEDCGGQLHVTRGKKTETLPLSGLLVNPAWSEDGNQLVVLRGVGGSSSPDLGAQPWYEVVRLDRGKKGWTPTVLGSTTVSTFRAPRPTVVDGRVYWAEARSTKPRHPSDMVLVSVDLEGRDKVEHMNFGGAQEVRLSPDGRQVAFKRGHEAWVAHLPAFARGLSVDAVPHRKLTERVGDWLDWKPNSGAVTWIDGRERSWVDVSTLTLGPDAEAPEPATQLVDVRLPRAKPEGTVAITGATVLTMEPAEGGGTKVLEGATVVVEGDRITRVEIGGAVPDGARVIDGTGKFVVPGLIDVHAHAHYSAGDVLPEEEWRYAVNLDFGVTTLHDPSANTDLVFTQKERVAAGLMQGPRVFSTGYILYGALGNDNATTASPEDAMRHVERLKRVGAGSVKIYQQSRRDQRQWYVDACNALELLCVAEGGGDLWMNLGMVADGFQAIEHALPIAPLYDDVIQWMAASHTDDTVGTAYTQTLLVAYGGLGGENHFYQHHNPTNDARLLRNFPRRILDRRAWRPTVLADDADWNFQQVARDAARMARAGTLVTLGAHGQLQGLGAHWELWSLASEGAMTPEEAWVAATRQGAVYLGLGHLLGTVTPGKLADLILLNADPRTDVHNSTDISLVIHNGVVRE